MNSKNLKYIYLLILLQIYLIGFFFRENIAGGAENDFTNLTWPAILSFKDNFFLTLKNYAIFGEGSPPIFHILNAYLNPFTFSQIAFQGSITILSLLNIFIFSNIIEKRFKINKIDSYLYGSIFLILPFFRSSSYWGLTENIGWLFLLISIQLFLDLKKKNSISKIFFLTLFSSLALYTRPYLVFFPIFLILISLINKNLDLFKKLSFFYILLALPGIYLIYLWGGSAFIGTGEQKINLFQEFHNPKFIIKNLVIFSSIFLFYLIPIEVIFFLKEKKFPNLKSIIIFIFFLLTLLLFNHFNYFDYLKDLNLGGGVILKTIKLFFNNQIIIFLMISAIGLTLMIKYLMISKSNNILFFSLLIYCFPKFIFQEYFEPLMIILFFSLFDFKNKNLILFQNNKNIIIFISYFFTYFCGAFFYRYFL